MPVGHARERSAGGRAQRETPRGERRDSLSDDIVLLRRIFREIRPYGRHILGVLLLSLLATPLALLGPVPLKIAVDSVLGSDPLPWLLQPLVPESLLSSVFGLLLLAAGLQVLIVLLVELQTLTMSVLQSYAGEKMTLAFRARLLSHVQRLSFAFHDSRGTADSIYRIQYDAPSIQRVSVESAIPFAASTFTLVSMIYVMVRLDWQLSLVALTVCPLLFFLIHSYRVRVRPEHKHAKRLESKALDVVQEVLTSFRVVKAFGREEHEERRFVEQSSQGMRLRLRLAVADKALSLLVNLTTALGTAAVLFIGVRNVQSGVLTLGELLMVITYMGQLYGPLRTITRRVGSLQNQLVSAQRAFELLDETPEVTERPNARRLGRARGEIEFRDVSFSYDARSPVLEHVSFALQPGTRLGIVGPTGTGKTTLVSLLSRFYDPTEGQILLDGVDLRDYRLDDLRRQFAIVLQEPVLFSTSIAENIAYARPEAELSEIVAAARAAGADGFISELPDGYDTLVGERGMRLSGGERQRISLARAFLKDAPILVLDEPTSSVDVKTEAAIMEALDRLMEHRTTFMIAHRLGTLDGCDLLLRLGEEPLGGWEASDAKGGLASAPLRASHGGRREA